VRQFTPAAIAALALGGCAPHATEAPVPVPAGWRLTFAYTFDHVDTTVWSLSTHTFDGNAAQFNPRNIAIRHGRLVLTLRPEHLGERQYSGAELQIRRQIGPFTYGRYEVRMRAARGNAVISSWFGFNDPPPWREIDIEFLGDHPNAVQANVYNAREGNPTLIPPFPILTALPFDATADFHTYAFEWSPTEIRWYADTMLVARTTSLSQVPAGTIRPMLNLWLSTDASWAGPIDPGVLPAHAEYEWVRVYTRS
jgi:endo-1,3-1,4-beta-glycanase ExoK